jgi:hypothetical protein
MTAGFASKLGQLFHRNMRTETAQTIQRRQGPAEVEGLAHMANSNVAGNTQISAAMPAELVAWDSVRVDFAGTKEVLLPRLCTLEKGADNCGVAFHHDCAGCSSP